MYEELVKTVRLCVEQPCCDNCPRYDNGLDPEECTKKLMLDCADAIERLTAEVDRKDKALQAWVTQINNLRTAYDDVHSPYGKECYAFRFGYLDQTIKMVLGITEDANEQQP